jgi:putative ABC transport system substrate-binding protein
MGADLDQKRLGLLHDLFPKAARFGLLVNSSSPSAEIQTKDVQAAAAVLGTQIEVRVASTNREIESAFAELAQKRVDAVSVGTAPLFGNRRVQLVTLASHYRLPAIYTNRDFVDVGGLMSYGTNLSDVYRQAGIYTGRILKGEKPADLPVMRASKFELVINLETGRILNIDFPAALLSIADEVIE